MRDWITVKEASEQSGYTIQHLIRLLKEEKLGGRQFGRFWVIDPDALEDYLERARSSDDARRGPRRLRRDVGES